MHADRRTRIAALEHEKTHQVMKDLAATSSLSRHGRFTYKYGQSSRPLTFSSGVCVFLFHSSFSTIADAYPRRSPYASIRHCSSEWHALRNQLTRVYIWTCSLMNHDIHMHASTWTSMAMSLVWIKMKYCITEQAYCFLLFAGEGWSVVDPYIDVLSPRLQAILGLDYCKRFIRHCAVCWGLGSDIVMGMLAS